MFEYVLLKIAQRRIFPRMSRLELFKFLFGFVIAYCTYCAVFFFADTIPL